MNSRLKINLPLDIVYPEKTNPYIYELIRTLENQSCTVDVGLSFFKDGVEQYDIIFFQWPEAVFRMKEPDDSQFIWLDDHLKKVSNKSLIITTIHNELPHAGSKDVFYKLYSIVYKYSHAFIHFGKASEGIINNQFPEETLGKIHQVIPHGNYNYFGAKAIKSEARKKLGLPINPKLVLVLGALRSNEEQDLIFDSLPFWAEKDNLLLFHGKIAISLTSYRLSALWKRGYAEFKKILLSVPYTKPKYVILRPGHVPNEMVSDIVSASDVILIPRRNGLNSGNIALGFTYGKIVVGPDTGNIGQILKENNNPVFKKDANPEEIGNAIKTALNLVDSDIANSNFDTAKKDWAWENTGLMYSALFKKLLEERNETNLPD